MAPTPQLVWSFPSNPSTTHSSTPITSAPPVPTPHGGTIFPPTCFPAELCNIQRRSLELYNSDRSITTFWAAPNDPHILAKEFGFYVLMLVGTAVAMWVGCLCVAAGRRVRRSWEERRREERGDAAGGLGLVVRVEMWRSRMGWVRSPQVI